MRCCCRRQTGRIGHMCVVEQDLESSEFLRLILRRPVRSPLKEVPWLRLAAEAAKLVKFRRHQTFNMDSSAMLATTRTIRAVYRALQMRDALPTSTIQSPCGTQHRLIRSWRQLIRQLYPAPRPSRARRISFRRRSCPRTGERLPSRPAECCVPRRTRYGFQLGSPPLADASPPRAGWPTARLRRCRRA